ncbi:MAG: thiol:disulfide interchange protein DsbA/DsbL [Cellvibrionales bacterium TMED148]|nr:disulfide bond formation protein DsbA [Porticoccaceae bacterium]RPG93431.1 MAG: thiol:disulfide interchange protein DsbA/DsbL [Cellvibrionales bacterium TMED148]
MNLFVRLLIALCLFPPYLYGEKEPQYQLNVHYELLPQAIRTTNTNRIEVNELFSYHCGHCYDFQEMIHDWSHTLEKDIDFVRTHVVWNPALENYAKAYNTALVLDVVDSVHQAIFEAIHIRKKDVKSQENLQEIFVARGVDQERFERVFNSFGVKSMVNKGQARVRGYRTKGTPELVINGKYRVTTRLSGGFVKMLKVADFLIDKERMGAK